MDEKDDHVGLDLKYKNKNIIKCLREVVSKCRDGLSLEHRAEDDF